MSKEHKLYISYSNKQKEESRNIDLISFLSKYEGFTFKKAGNGYKCVEHNSLYIKADRKQWYWNSHHMGGNNVIDYLTSIHSMTYIEAMKVIVGSAEKLDIVKSTKTKKVEQKELILPKKADSNYARMYAYLLKSRGIDKDIVNDCVKNKLIYQDEHNNVVFVGYDDTQQPRFACIRGTLTDVQYRGDCSGSDKKYPFIIKGSASNRVYVFESPIDAMSYMTMFKEASGNNYKQHTYLSLSGTADVGLESYLERNQSTRQIVFCLDNDDSGNKACDNYMLKYYDKGYEVVRKRSVLKDYNMDLLKSLDMLTKKNIYDSYKETIDYHIKTNYRKI